MGVITKFVSAESSSFWGKFSLVSLFILLAASFILPFFLPNDYKHFSDLEHLFLPPLTKGHVLGTNEFGRDMLSGLLYGLQTSFIIAGVSTFLAFTFGSFLGVWSAYKGGIFEKILGRLIELQLSIPSFLIALLLIAFLGHGFIPLIAALILGQWAYFAQTARAVAKSEIRQEYVLSARLLGLSSFYIVRKHLLPNAIPPQIVVFSYQLARAIALESALSFLGVGVPLTEPSLGLFIAQGYAYFLNKAYWVSLFPGIVLILLVMMVTKIGDYLNTIYDRKDS
jgi:peptide/nickel transport system permease protein